MKSPLNDRRFIKRRNFRNKQAPSAMVIYNDAAHTQRSTAHSKGNQTHAAHQIAADKHKSLISQMYS